MNAFHRDEYVLNLIISDIELSVGYLYGIRFYRICNRFVAHCVKMKRALNICVADFC